MNKEWEHEPNRIEFEHAGFKCLILRHPELGQLNGYVGLKRGHPYYRKSSDDIDVDVHGGLTFAQIGEGINWSKGYWWIGFDTGHLWDYQPGMEKYIEPFATYKNIDYVTKEVKRLAEQLAPVNMAIRKMQRNNESE